MLKKVIFASIAILLLIGAAGYFYLNSIIKHAIEEYGSTLTGSTVEVTSVHILPFSGAGEIHYGIIHNPEKFNSEYAVYFDSIDLRIDLRSLFSDTVLIKQLHIMGPKINYEFNPYGNNIETIRTHITRSTLHKAGNNIDQKKKLIIESLHIQPCEVAIITDFLGTKKTENFSIPAIDLHNLGQTQPLTVKHFATILTHAIHEQLIEHKGKVLQHRIESLKEGFTDTIKSLF